ncbi:hypothetical protein Droror1_Dr00026736 [Drosera rotundifolia]
MNEISSLPRVESILNKERTSEGRSSSSERERGLGRTMVLRRRRGGEGDWRGQRASHPVKRIGVCSWGVLRLLMIFGSWRIGLVAMHGCVGLAAGVKLVVFFTELRLWLGARVWDRGVAIAPLVVQRLWGFCWLSWWLKNLGVSSKLGSRLELEFEAELVPSFQRKR